MKPYEKGFLEVSEIHKIYYEQTGNPMGAPVLYVHGGPGAGLPEDYHQYFNLRKWRVIASDQRGAGKSIPQGCLEHNTLQYLIEDLELLRQKLRVKKWVIFGGSWGSTLALAYAHHYPHNVESLVLKSIFLGRKTDVDWLYEEGGISRIFPQLFESYIPEAKEENILKYYYQNLQSDNPKIVRETARRWIAWELNLSSMQSPHLLSEWFDIHMDKGLEAFALIESHYFFHHCFLDPTNGILPYTNNLSAIKVYIFHGRWDWVCPFDGALKLKKHLPLTTLKIYEDEGHFFQQKTTQRDIFNCMEEVFQQIK